MSLEPNTNAEAAPAEIAIVPEATVVESVEVVEAPAVRALFGAHQRPRIWPVLVVGLLALPVSFVVSTVVFLGLMIADVGLIASISQTEMTSWLSKFASSRLGLFALVLPGQMVFLFAALGAAMCSPLGVRKRLSFFGGTMPIWSWILFAVGTPMIGFATSAILTMFVKDLGPQLEMMHQLFRGHDGWFVVIVVFLVAVLPGFAEEMLFRGYIQSRLLKRWPPIAAIGFTSVLFALAHLDPIHVLAVLPLGIWLGILAWRCDSIWPSIICHVVNNCVAIVVTQLTERPGEDLPMTAGIGAIIVASLVSLFVGVGLLWFAPRREPALPASPTWTALQVEPSNLL